MSSSSRRGGGEHVQAPDRLRRGAGQRHVDRGRRARRSLELLAAELRRRAPRSAPPAPGAPGWRPCRPPPRCSGCELGDAAQQLRQLGLAPEVAHAQLLERLAAWRAAAIVRLGLRAQLLDPLDHDAGTLDDAPGVRRRVPRVSSYSATVAAIAAFSDSAAIGMCATRSHARTTLLRQALALGADEQRDARPRRLAAEPARAAARRAPAHAARRRSPGSSRRRSLHARERRRAKIAPMLARTAFGECGSAQPGPERHA